MKKIGVFVIFLLLLVNLISISLVLAENETQVKPPIDPDQIESMKNKLEGKWDYLSLHWRLMLLQNPVMFQIDKACKWLDKAGFFVILFGVHWILNVTVLLTMAFWIFFFFFFKRQFKKAAGWDNAYCYIASLFLVVFLAQVKLWVVIANEIVELCTTRTGQIIFTITFLIFLWICFFVDKYITPYLKQLREGTGENRESIKRIDKFEQGLREGSKEA